MPKISAAPSLPLTSHPVVFKDSLQKDMQQFALGANTEASKFKIQKLI